MAIFFRKFEVRDAGGDKSIFKHYPNQADKIVVEEDTLDSSLPAREKLINFIKATHSYMSENSINKVEIEEGED